MKAELVNGTLRLVSDGSVGDADSREAVMHWLMKGCVRVQLVVRKTAPLSCAAEQLTTAGEITKVWPPLDDRSLAQRDVLDHLSGMPTPAKQRCHVPTESRKVVDLHGGQDEAGT